jgi:phospholipid/cholesterol/gamma-HCH transport system substrate-binding protein
VRTETRVGFFILGSIVVFLYLSTNIRNFRFNKDSYNEYRAYFDDTGGITAKAQIRIAGVDVGWVESIKLLAGGKAELLLFIHHQNRLAKNAYAMINQEGLIGAKNVEIDPGDPSTGILLPGSILSMPGKTPTSVGELLDQFKGIAGSIQDITSSLKSAFATRKAEKNMKLALTSIAQASERMADFSLILKQTLEKNQENINLMLNDFKETASSLKKGVPQLTKDVSLASTKAGSAFEQIEDASVQARDAFKEAGTVMEKINTGKGVVGKLINEDETYGDLKKTIGGFKEFVTKTQSLIINVDMHSESMLRHQNSKGYFEMRLRPHYDYFYLLQLVGDEYGTIKREVSQFIRKDEKGNVLLASKLDIPLEKKLEFADEIERTVRKKNDILFGLQFGKRFDRLAFRIGLFESTFGCGVDFYVPLKTDLLHWISTVEAFDFRGTNRLNDNRPHIKWLNRVFFMKNIYTTFGIDDIYSKNSANPFWGAGLRFGDDDLKYFISMFSAGKGK